jgi:hypothetical protein
MAAPQVPSPAEALEVNNQCYQLVLKVAVDIATANGTWNAGLHPCNQVPGS